MGPVLGRLFSNIKMRAFAFVLLAAAAVVADSDPYTIGQVASGLTHGGVVTGVDYSNGVVSGVGAIGNRAYAGHVGYAGVGHLGYANHVVAALLLTLELLLLPLCTPVLFPPQLSTDMLDTTMASVKLTLMLMLTPLDRLLLVSPSTMPMLLDTPTMLVL